MYYMMGDNSKFEHAALKILLLKDPRCCCMLFGKNYNYLTIYAYVLGIASVIHDSRILEAIRYTEGYDEDNIKAPLRTDKDKLQDFFEYFNDSILYEVRRYDCKNRLLLRKLDFSREEKIIQSEQERISELNKLEELLRKVPGNYTGFIKGAIAGVQHSHMKCIQLIQYINDNPEASCSDIVKYIMDDLGIVAEGHVAELERYVSFGIDVEEDDYDCLGRWLCMSVPEIGYGLFSRDTWTSDELLPILEKYI